MNNKTTQNPFLKYLGLLWGIGIWIFLLSGCSLAEDVTPPPDYEQVRAQRATLEAPVLPVTSPNVAMGEQIFQNYCAACHGSTGQGDGDQVNTLSSSIPVIVEPETYRLVAPTSWFQVITLGRNEMPAFSNMLTPAERWDAIAYIYRLSFQDEEIQAGKEIYQAACLECHGEKGEGNDSTPDWRDPARLAIRSDEELINAIMQGKSPGMPGFADRLLDDQPALLVSFIRASFFIAGDEQTEPESTLEPVLKNQGIITGGAFNVTNSSSTSGLQATLFGFDDESGAPSFNKTVKTDNSGVYLFEDVEAKEGRTYVVTVSYQGVLYYSSPIEARELMNGQTVKRPVEIFEASREISRLSVERMHVFVDFAEDGALQIVQMLLINNPLQVAVIGEKDNGPVLKFNLPAGATNLRFDDSSGQRFFTTVKGFEDYSPVQPGSVDQILFAYDIPYDGEVTFSLPMDMDVSQVLVMVPDGMLEVASDQLTSMGQQQLDGVTVNMLSAADLKAGSTVRLEVSGRLTRGLKLNTGSVTNLGIGLVVLGIVMAVALAFYSQKRKKEQILRDIDTPQTINDVMDAIIALDDRFQAGELPEKTYQTRRANMKARLEEMLQSEEVPVQHD